MKKLQKTAAVAITAILVFNLCLFSASAKEVKTVYLGGEPFGLKMYTCGAMIIDFESYYNGKEYVCPAKDCGLCVSDVIKEANGQKINSNEDFEEAEQKSLGKTIKLKLTRNGKSLEKDVTPQKNNGGTYLIGAWIRDSCAGIGTITYYDSDKNYFAALGHGICDTKTNALLPLEKGVALKANIGSVIKSENGLTGSLSGYFDNKVIGKLQKNSNIGVYGTISDNYVKDKIAVEIADVSEVRVGKASIFSTIDGESPKQYSIEISSICSNSTKSGENFVIKVTDKALIEKTGGIVQGMSGSPIMQNGKLVGAVTHVFVDSPCEGYGIIAQNMVLNYEN